jgi:hypothetical protein
MHGYIMPYETIKDNLHWQITWLHYAAIKAAPKREDPAIAGSLAFNPHLGAEELPTNATMPRQHR